MKYNLGLYAHDYLVKRKASTNPLNSYYTPFLFADIDITAHISHRTVSIVTTQTSFHGAVDDSNRNQLASLTTANEWNFAYLEG